MPCRAAARLGGKLTSRGYVKKCVVGGGEVGTCAATAAATSSEQPPARGALGCM